MLHKKFVCLKQEKGILERQTGNRGEVGVVVMGALDFAWVTLKNKSRTVIILWHMLMPSLHDYVLHGYRLKFSDKN